MNKIVHCKKATKGTFVYIGRPSLLGNPYPLDDPRDDQARKRVVEQYRSWFLEKLNDPGFRQAVEEVRGHDLGCWCAPHACHGDVILEWLTANPNH